MSGTTSWHWALWGYRVRSCSTPIRSLLKSTPPATLATLFLRNSGCCQIPCIAYNHLHLCAGFLNSKLFAKPDRNRRRYWIKEAESKEHVFTQRWPLNLIFLSFLSPAEQAGYSSAVGSSPVQSNSQAAHVKPSFEPTLCNADQTHCNSKDRLQWKACDSSTCGKRI